MIAALTLAALTVAPRVHHTVSTASAVSQTRFDRGLALLYAYNEPAAQTAFAAALQADPHLAIAAWGEALAAAGTDLNTAATPEGFSAAHDFAQQARRLESFASPEERALIDAVNLRYAGTFDNRGSADEAYRTAMARIVETHPNDEDVAMLDAEALMEVQIGDSQARALIFRVLAGDPQQVMANHLCVHSYDFESDHSPSLPCADRLAAMHFSPEEAHLAHMPAHSYVENGLYAKAVAVSERAWQLRVQLSDTKYRTHDAYVAWTAAMMTGNLAASERWARRAGEAYGGSDLWATWARFAQWPLIAGSSAQGEFFAPLARGLTDIHFHVLDDARAMLRQYGDADTDFRWILQAAVDDAQGHVDDAAVALRHADSLQAAQDQGEQLPVFPAAEYLGSLYLRHGRYDDAATAYNAALVRFPNDPRALYGLALTERAQGRQAGAQQTMNLFHGLWMSTTPPDIGQR